MGKFSKMALCREVLERQEKRWEKSLYQLLAEYEEELIRQALVESGGNVAKAGRIMGIGDPSNMRRRVKMYGLSSFVSSLREG